MENITYPDYRLINLDPQHYVTLRWKYDAVWVMLKYGEKQLMMYSVPARNIDHAQHVMDQIQEQFIIQ